MKFLLLTCSDSVGYAILLNFLVYVTLPVPLNFAGILLGIGTFTFYVAMIIGLGNDISFVWNQVNKIVLHLCISKNDCALVFEFIHKL